MSELVTAEQARRLVDVAAQGPWTAEQDWIEFGVPDNTKTIRDADGTLVGWTALHYSHQDSASLIAAAPDLAATVIALYGRLEAAEDKLRAIILAAQAEGHGALASVLAALDGEGNQ